MLGDLSRAEKIYIACGYTDMRKSIDGLAALVQQNFQPDPFSMFFVKHFSLKKALKFPVFIKGFSLFSAGTVYASRRMRACSIR